jgi:hypothetical protein
MRNARIAVGGALALLVLASALSGPVRADGGAEVQVWQGRGSWQERGRQNEHWRSEHRFDGYYSAPPVIYADPYYTQQPGMSLNFNFPLFR